MTEEPLGRREFLQSAALAAAAAGVGLGLAHAVTRTPAQGPPRVLSLRAWRALAAAFDQLMPHDDLGPGAEDVNAVGYLDAVLADPRAPRRMHARMEAAAEALDIDARRQGALAFDGLARRERERALRRYVATPAGPAWLRSAFGVLFESFFGDPVRGGNPDGVGWQLIGHRPGMPRPVDSGWRPLEEL